MAAFELSIMDCRVCSLRCRASWISLRSRLYSDFAQFAVYGGGQSGKVLFQHVVLRPGSHGLYSGLLGIWPETMMKGISGSRSRTISSTSVPAKLGSL